MNRAVVLVLAAVLLGGCSAATDDPVSGSGPGPDPVPTLSALPPPPEPPPSGRLVADMRQSTIDASLRRMQVWIDNDTTSDVSATRIVYRDPRLPRPVPGQRLRTNPAQSERGYPLALPARPRCGVRVPAGSGRLTVVHRDGGVTRLRVQDPTDVVGRYLALRCQELALAEVADLRWDDEVGVTGTGGASTGTLTLLVRPTGVPGRRLVVHHVSGSHLLGSAAGPEAWTPRLALAGDDPPTRVELPLRPTRCDGHAFAEGGNATAFRVSLVLDGRPGEVLLRMSPAGMSSALAFAAAYCGLA